MNGFRRGSAILEALQPVVLAFAVFMMIYLFLFQPHKVDGNSMFPSFVNMEYILTDKVSYKRGLPKRGDVIVFHAPTANSDYIKRIIGMPGEVIMVKNGYVYINNIQLPEVYLPPSYLTLEKSFLRDGVPYPIPAGYYIALGDNRGYSSDSREFGPISKRAIVGKAWIRYWPLNRAGLIPHQRYRDFL